MKNFLERLQSSDETTKKQWMIGSTVVIVLVVGYVWLGYFNTLVPSFEAAPVTAPADMQGTNLTFWQTMQNGAAIISNSVMGELHALGNVLQAPRDYIVKPPQ